MISNWFYIAVTTFCSLLGTIQNQNDKLLGYIQKADIESLAEEFNSSIQLTVPGKEGVYSKAQAKIIIKDYFDTNKPNSASISNKGQNTNGAQYVTIAVSGAKGAYTVTINYRLSGTTCKIHEIKIEK